MIKTNKNQLIIKNLIKISINNLISHTMIAYSIKPVQKVFNFRKMALRYLRKILIKTMRLNLKKNY